jgi:hypothetical protein
LVKEGIQALNTAVGLNPNNAVGHLNLATALQRAGRLHDAVSSLTAALRIDPNHQKAQEALNAVQAQLQQKFAPPSATPSSPIPPAPSVAPAPSASAAPPDLGSWQPLTSVDVPPAGDEPQPSVFGSWGQATGAGIPCPSCKAENNADAQFCSRCGTSLRGSVCPSCQSPNDTNARFCGQCGASLKGDAPVPSQPWKPPAHVAPPDGISPAEEFENFSQILSAPVDFFQEQRERRGLLQPLTFLATGFSVIMLVILIPALALSFFQTNAPMEGLGIGGIIIGLLLSVIGFALGIVCILIGFLIVAGWYHLLCRVFQGQAGYAGTFRAMTYAMAPSLLTFLPSALIVLLALWLFAQEPMGLMGCFLLARVITLIGGVWQFVLLVIAFREVHETSTGRAFCAALLGALTWIAIISLRSSYLTNSVPPLTQPPGGFSVPSRPPLPGETPEFRPNPLTVPSPPPFPSQPTVPRGFPSFPNDPFLRPSFPRSPGMTPSFPRSPFSPGMPGGAPGFPRGP